ncbi:MAG: glucohydrolase [Bacteroidetes bacterium]|nr:glucohydrolase [Bacteroidota bacterium]
MLSLAISANAQNNEPWYHSTTIYQIYPRSYYDSNGDGIGDLPGIIQKLDYIKSLGYETIWLSPFYKSPQVDFGYDISDYTDIAPEYGTLADAQKLIDETHKHGMKIVFDMVMNHTSDQHPWFKESMSSRTNPKADWYIWADKPNHWSSQIRGTGWHYCKERNQYFWASFLPFQPDLNYRNPAVKKAMFDACRFWLAKGVDGFRLDMINSIYKDSLLRNNTASRRAVARSPETKKYRSTIKGSLNQPETFEFAKELRAVCDSFGDRMLLGEVYGTHPVVKEFLGGQKNNGLGLVFNFEMLRFHYNAKYFSKLVANLEKDFPAPYSPVYVFSNHDRRRSMKRLKDDMARAKLLHVFQLTTRGVSCMYYGEEIGMSDLQIPYKDALDPIGQKYKKVPRWLSELFDETLNRDDLRTPMQWDNSANAGFSTSAKTWLPVNPNYMQINAKTEVKDENSLLLEIQALLLLHKRNKVLHDGSLELIPKQPHGVLAYKRKLNDQEVIVILNFSKKPKEVKLSGTPNSLYQIHKTDKYDAGTVHLSALGAMILGK